MKVTQLNHIALQVRDVAVTQRFYEEVVGLRAIPRPAFKFPGAWLRIGVDQELHLIAAPAPGSAAAASSSSRGDHFAVMVDSIADAQAHLRARNISFKGPHHRPDGARQIFFEDPDGHLVEFCTPPNPNDLPKSA